jgi:alkylhydroperoxidase family enzyme
MNAAAPRVTPGGRAELGLVNAAIARVAGAASGGPPPHIFTTLGRHRGLFRRWLLFAGALMPGGRLPRPDSELVILRVAHNCASDYEWSHHERLGRAAGLTAEEIARVRDGADAPGWTPRQAMLLRVADELHADRAVSDATWALVSGELSDVDALELRLLVGHYEMLAMTLNGLRVQPDAFTSARPPRLVRAIEGLRARRAGR